MAGGRGKQVRVEVVVLVGGVVAVVVVVVVVVAVVVVGGVVFVVVVVVVALTRSRTCNMPIMQVNMACITRTVGPSKPS